MAFAILAGLLALGVVAVFVFGQTRSGGSALVAKPGASATISAHRPSAAGSKRSALPAPAGSTSLDPASGASADPSVSGSGDPTTTGVYTPEFYIGECVDTNGSGVDFAVSAAACKGAEYKIIYAFQDESGDIGDDMSQCYAINGDDNEFENGDADDGYTLYCMNSLTGDYSPRRAEIDNCLDSTATYEVDCTSSKAAWIVIGRLDDTTDTKDCSRFGSYDNSYYWTSAPPYVLCVDRYNH